jgi:hypothetical protein
MTEDEQIAAVVKQIEVNQVSTRNDAEVLTEELTRYGIPVSAGLEGLLRHIYNSRDLVYSLKDQHVDMLVHTRPSMHIVRWAAQECAWQMSGELSVGWMLEAWQYAVEHQSEPITLEHVLELGRLVEPKVNAKGLRKVGVRVGYSIKPRPDEVPAMLDRLIEHQPDIPVDDSKLAVEWFKSYEEVHPWRDGNGRSGAILYAWLLGKLMAPPFPPNLWNDPRR